MTSPGLPAARCVVTLTATRAEREMQSREKIVTANGVDICADAFGDRSHPAILLTPDHGLEVATQIPGASTELVAWR